MAQQRTPEFLSESEAALAKKTSRILAPRMRRAKPLELRVVEGSKLTNVTLPAPAVRMLVRILDEMASGNALALIPVHAELTTQQAANMLNISRPSLIELLDRGQIAFRKIGTHRRVQLESLFAYKRAANASREAALAELAAYDRELGI